MRRIDILLQVKEHMQNNRFGGLCNQLLRALFQNKVNFNGYDDIPRIFPAFTRENAMPFGASKYNLFWWPCGEDKGRFDFLDWLIDYYKDDKTDLRALQL